MTVSSKPGFQMIFVGLEGFLNEGYLSV